MEIHIKSEKQILNIVHWCNGSKVEYSGIATGERKTTIEFVCWSRSQLDYLQPYFLFCWSNCFS